VLLELSVTDLGVVDGLRLLLGPGLTAVTGETGAGKTLVVHAIDLLVGGRADAAMVRPGAAEAVVEGRFELDGEELVVTRVVPADGRSRAYLDGRMATAAALQELGARVVDLHGQHQHQSLLQRAHQRAALDRFAAIDLAPLAEADDEVRRHRDALAALGGDARERARHLDLLRHQAAELDAARLDDPDEEDRLVAEIDLLADATAHRLAAEQARHALTADGGAVDQLAGAVAALGDRAPFAEVAGRLRGAAAEVEDAAAELRAVAEGIEDDPDRLAAANERRRELRELRRKFGDSLADVLRFRDELRVRIDELEHHDTRAAELEAALAAARERRAAEAAVVGVARRAAAPALAAAVGSHLGDLALPHAALEVAVGAEDPGDEVSFGFDANRSGTMLPLNRVASGGELARVMLALRLVLTAGPATLVFDEVDAGIGGSAAAAVADALAGLARRHQVLVVTHLPQVAAVADRHVVVSKSERAGRVSSTATAVRDEDRVTEVARMLSGQPGSATARRHAEELLGARS
jgi:DNA repair protein RecN (Recombination protein N)